jgi:N-hydroxyarylamine O-acetyltransferase
MEPPVSGNPYHRPHGEIGLHSCQEPLPGKVVARYLDILQVAAAVPSFVSLAKLVRAHLTRIPFENVSKLYYLRRYGLVSLPQIEMYLDGIEKHHFGGTCYSNNYYFHLLLRSLGYEAKLCAADMKVPGIHAVNIIAVDGREYLVDTGYAAPLLEPILRDLTVNYEITLGRDRYVLAPQDADGRSRLDLYRDGVLRHGYLARPAPRTIEDFSGVIAGSFRPGATFLNALLLARFYPDASTVIHNQTLIQSKKNDSTVQVLADYEELIAAIEKHFGMPHEIVAEVVSQLGPLQDAWT